MKKNNAILALVVILLTFSFSCNSQNEGENMEQNKNEATEKLKIFLCGDVMTGRGIDQALPHSVDPVLYESYVKDARDYLALAENASGNIDTPVGYDYIWGDALKEWKKNNPDLKIINLETSITTNDEPWPNKGINYRMHPENVEILKVAGIDHCSLANNHSLDWGRRGLIETMETLSKAGIKFSGAGRTEKKAGEPSVFETDEGRVLVYSIGSPTSGIPDIWAAEGNTSGLNYLTEFTEKEINQIKKEISAFKKPGDIIVFSIHWGGNWGYGISSHQKAFAYELIDEADVDIIYGHSSHHPIGMEVYNNRLIIYGAGDFINDYEGISGHERYRGDLSLMYFPELERKTGKLLSLKMVPLQIEKFRLNHASRKDAEWLQERLDRESEKLGARVRIDGEGILWLVW